MISEYKYKIISKVIQNLVTWCSENNDKKNQMICVYFQGVLNDYKNKKNKSASSQAPERVGPPNKVKGSKQG